MQDYAVRAPSQLATLIAGFRKARKLSQRELASRLGTVQQSVSAFEREPGPASIERLLKTLAALDVELVLRDRQAPSPAGARRPRSGQDW
jgi:HTH-type transcriptional regulator / antitoxin HipB